MTEETKPANEAPPETADELVTDDSPPEADIQAGSPDEDSSEDWESEELEFSDEAEFDRLMAEDEKAIRAKKPPAEPATEPEPKAADDKAEPENEAEGESEAEQEAEKTRTELATTVGALLGEGFESDDAAVERVRAIKDENEGYAALQDLLQGNEKLGAFFKAMLEDGADPADAAVAAFSDLSRNRPDPYDDPDAYAEYMKREGVREADARHAAAQEKAYADRVERAKKDVDRAFNSFVATRGLNETEAKAFAERFALYRLGDPDTGRVPPDVFERERKAENYDHDVKDAYERGLSDGKNEGIKKVTARRGMRGDGIPALEGSRKPVATTPGADQEWEKEAAEFARDGKFDGDW